MWTDWVYAGEPSEYRESIVQPVIYETFGDETVYIAIDRHRSFAAPAAGLLPYIVELLQEQQTVALVDLEFDRRMEFARIGVFRVGRREREGLPSEFKWSH